VFKSVWFVDLFVPFIYFLLLLMMIGHPWVNRVATRVDVDDRFCLHCRIQSGTSSRPLSGFPERLDNYGSLLRSVGISCGVHTLSARHRTQRARLDDDYRLANVNQSGRISSSFSSVAIPSSMAGRLEFLQPQVRPPCPHIDRCLVSCTFGPRLLMFTVGLLVVCPLHHNTLAKHN
jgi:hypothetical protein